MNAGLASHVGEILKMPVGQHVQGDGTVLVQVDGRQADPCLPNPCTYSNLPRCEVVNAGTVKCSSKYTQREGDIYQRILLFEVSICLKKMY